MNVRRFGWAVMVLAALMSVLPLERAQAQEAAPFLECVIDRETVSAGEEFTVTVLAWDVENLFAYQFELNYDTELAEVVDSDPQQPGVNADLKDFLKPDLVIFNQAEPRLGMLSVGASEAYPSEPVTGSGPLAEVRLTALMEGELSLEFGAVTLADPEANTIAASTTGCSVQVLPAGEATPTRELIEPQETPLPPGAATEISSILATFALTPSPTGAEVDGTEGTPDGEEEGYPSAGETGEPFTGEEMTDVTPVAETDEEEEGAPNFLLSLLAGLGLVLGLAGVGLFVLWLRARPKPVPPADENIQN